MMSFGWINLFGKIIKRKHYYIDILYKIEVEDLLEMPIIGAVFNICDYCSIGSGVCQCHTLVFISLTIKEIQICRRFSIKRTCLA